MVRTGSLALIFSWSIYAASFAGCASASGSEDEVVDSGRRDSGKKDTGPEIEEEDTEPLDSSSADSSDVSADSSSDTGASDTASADSGSVDTGSVDTGAKDTGSGPTDTGPTCGTEEKEPNEDESTAVQLLSITDCDGAGNTVKGVLTSSRDVDWWKFRGTDTFGCTVDPTIAITGTVRLCAFIQCAVGTSTTFNKCTKGSKTTSPDGRAGCCADTGGNIAIDFSCPAFGSDDGADIYMRVDDPTATTCKDYSISYHF